MTEDSLENSLARQLRAQAGGRLSLLKPGEVFADRYKILRLLGHGGMGLVYEAEHLLAPALRFAVKILLPRVGEEPSEQVIREATSIGKIRHRNVVRVIDVGRSKDNLSYLVMEFVGPDLGEYVSARGGTLPAVKAVEFCIQVCDALTAAHSQGIVHRDIKPSNCLVHNESGVDYVIVSDFGLARALPGEDSSKRTWTKVGTKGYTAPEIERGESGQKCPDHRVDIYSVGAMLACLIAGAPPRFSDFDGRKERAEYFRRFPRTLLPILKRTLATDPDRRFGSAAELGAALRHSLPDLEATSPGSGRVTRMSFRTKLGILLTLSVGAAVVIVIVIVAYLGAPVPLVGRAPTGADSEPEPAVDLGVARSNVSREEAAPASAAAPEEVGTTQTVEAGRAKAARRPRESPSNGQSLKSTALEINSPQMFLDEVCSEISAKCGSHSETKRLEEYAGEGSLEVRLETVQVYETQEPFFRYGLLRNDGGFQDCARAILVASVKRKQFRRRELHKLTCLVKL